MPTGTLRITSAPVDMAAIETACKVNWASANSRFFDRLTFFVCFSGLCQIEDPELLAILAQEVGKKKKSKKSKKKAGAAAAAVEEDADEMDS